MAISAESRKISIYWRLVRGTDSLSSFPNSQSSSSTTDHLPFFQNRTLHTAIPRAL